MSYNTLWTIPDELWSKFIPILPSEKLRSAVGRPPLPNRQVLNWIPYVLRTGCRWKAPRTKWFGASNGIHARYQACVQEGIFVAIFRLLVAYYDRRRGIQWKWQALESKSVAAP